MENEVNLSLHNDQEIPRRRARLVRLEIVITIAAISFLVGGGLSGWVVSSAWRTFAHQGDVIIQQQLVLAEQNQRIADTRVRLADQRVDNARLAAIAACPIDISDIEQLPKDADTTPNN
jgi:hypothetical protein